MEELAILGGGKVRTKPFTKWPIFDQSDINSLVETCESGVWGVSGTKVPEFEKKFSALHDCKHGTCVTNGTSSLEVALRALSIGAGDEFIVTPYTFIASASSILAVNAIPIFVDIDPDTYNIDATKIEEAITEKTKGIMAVHIAGLPVDMDAVIGIARKHNLAVIEDCAQAHIAEWRGKKVGSIGDIGAFSFQSSKNLCCGEGGIVITNNSELAERVDSLHNFGRIPGGKWYEHHLAGTNLRMTQFQAAILLSQLTRLEEQSAKREDNAEYLSKKLSEIPGIHPLAKDPRVTRHAYHLYIFRYDSSEFEGLPKAEFIKAMNAEGIPCSAGYVPLYREKMFNLDPTICPMGCGFYGKAVNYSNVSCPVTERVCATEAIWLHQQILLGGHGDMDDIATAATKIQANAGKLVK